MLLNTGLDTEEVHLATRVFEIPVLDDFWHD